MSNLETKAIFYAYSNNALDQLAPYAVLCKEKKIPCTVIYGEDFVKQKVRPRNNIIQIFKDYNIKTHIITNIKKEGLTQIIFCYIWHIVYMIESYQFIPNFFKNKIKGLTNKIFLFLDGELIGKNAAIRILKDQEKVLVFTDNWDLRKKFQNSFLSNIKGKATIISTNQVPYHFHNPAWQEPNKWGKEDIAFVANHWEAADKTFIDRKVVIGNLRYSKKWSSILDDYNVEKITKSGFKKKVLVLTHTESHTSDWERMLKLLHELNQKEDISLCILPHIRGMINMKPPKGLEKVWDKTTTLDVAVKKSDIIIFWESSGIFEAVLRNKKIIFLSFLTLRKFIWENNASKNMMIKNEKELFEELNNYNKNDVIDNYCFEEIIWSKGDPWLNASNFLDKFLGSEPLN